MGDVIEHVQNPLHTLELVQDILKPGGFVIISTPNVGRWAARLLQIKPEEHLYYFTPQTMSSLLNRAGLEVTEIHSLDRYHNLTAMTHSTTFGGLFQLLGPLFQLMHRLLGNVVVRLPLRENLLAVARKPAPALAEAA